MVRTGLEGLLAEGIGGLKGQRVGFCGNHTAVDADLRHAVDRLIGAGVPLVRLFGPEHGVRATAQDMEHVLEATDPVTGLPTVSLYGATEASLHPTPEALAGLDVIVFDAQDIGARYYTYQATLAFLMRVAGQVGVRVVVLDRPNPINGVSLEGNLVQPGFESFVGAFPLLVRHGLTMGELARYFQRYCAIDCEVEVVTMAGWRREMWFEDTGLPWVFPSPNMPTVDTATVYPGTCLIEGTNVSEGRGTTRPFHLIGAPWLDPQRFAAACEASAGALGLRGVRFRPHAFVPGFQKHAKKPCGAVEIHVTDRGALNAWHLGLAVTEAAWRTDPGAFRWRTETYEFVDVPIAIDLLCGATLVRETIESRGSLRDLDAGWADERAAFAARRAEILLY